MERPAELNPKRVWLDEKDCERMTKSQFEAMRCLLGAVSYAGHAKDDLKDRLGCIKYGKQRMAMAVGCLKALAEDLVGTMPQGQCRQIRNTMNDMEMRMVPKRMPMSRNVLLEADNAKALIDRAMEQCKGCVEDEVSCRKCGLYIALESILPLDSYENGMLCPYSMAEWKD